MQHKATYELFWMLLFKSHSDTKSNLPTVFCCCIRLWLFTKHYLITAMHRGPRDAFTSFFQTSEGLDNYMELIQGHMFLIVEGGDTPRKPTQTSKRTCKTPQTESSLPPGNWTKDLMKMFSEDMLVLNKALFLCVPIYLHHIHSTANEMSEACEGSGH